MIEFFFSLNHLIVNLKNLFLKKVNFLFNLIGEFSEFKLRISISGFDLNLNSISGKPLFFLFFISLFLTSTNDISLAQNVVKDETVLQSKVLYFNGNQVYINSGTSQLIANGDTLWIEAQATQRFAYLVIQASAKRSLIQPISESLNLTIGNDIQIYLVPKSNSEIQKEVQKKRSSLFDLPENTSSSLAKSTSPIISGRYMVGLNAMGSRTQWNEHIKDAVYRFSAEPSASYVLRASRLPGNWDVSINSRLDYRYNSRTSLTPATQLRLYEFQAEKKFTSLPLRLQLGRFYNRYDSFSGFWDGLLLETGNSFYGAGLIAGSEPVRSSEFSSISQPKVSAFTHLKWNIGAFTSNSELSLTQVKSSFGPVHRYAGFQQYFNWNKTRVSISGQIDKNTMGSNWRFSNFSTTIRQTIFSKIDISARYSRREPFRVWQPIVFGTVNEQVGAGFTVRHSGLYWGSDIYLMYLAGNNTAKSFNSWAQVPNRTPWNLDFQLSNQLWFGESSFVVATQLQTSKNWRFSWLSGGYLFNYSNYFDSVTHTHGLFVQWQKQFKKLGQLSLRYSVDAGLIMVRSGLTVSIWKSF